MADNETLECSECKFEYVLDVEHRPVCEDIVDVGHECPQCHTWFRSYYTNPILDKKRRLLRRFMAKAHLSLEDSQRYWRKKKEFATSHDLFQAKVKGLLQVT